MKPDFWTGESSFLLPSQLSLFLIFRPKKVSERASESSLLRLQREKKCCLVTTFPVRFRIRAREREKQKKGTEKGRGLPSFPLPLPSSFRPLLSSVLNGCHIHTIGTYKKGEGGRRAPPTATSECPPPREGPFEVSEVSYFFPCPSHEKEGGREGEGKCLWGVGAAEEGRKEADQARGSVAV